MQTLLDKDTTLFLFLNGLGSESWDSFWLLMTDKLTWIPLYLLCIIFIYKTERSILKALLIIVILAVLIGVNDGLSNLSKHYFARPRPCQVPEILQAETFRMVASYCSKYGYFSAHAANHFALAIFMGLYFRKLWRPALVISLFWASIVAYSRIYVGVHYPLDILTGALIGIFTGYLAFRCLLPLLKPKNSIRKT